MKSKHFCEMLSHRPLCSGYANYHWIQQISLASWISFITASNGEKEMTFHWVDRNHDTYVCEAKTESWSISILCIEQTHHRIEHLLGNFHHLQVFVVSYENGSTRFPPFVWWLFSSEKVPKIKTVFLQKCAQLSVSRRRHADPRHKYTVSDALRNV